MKKTLIAFMEDCSWVKGMLLNYVYIWTFREEKYVFWLSLNHLSFNTCFQYNFTEEMQLSEKGRQLDETVAPFIALDNPGMLM